MLVLEPVAGDDGTASGHEAVLYFRPLADRDTEEFFGDARYGEFWVGARPTLADIESELGLTARHIDEFARRRRQGRRRRSRCASCATPTPS